MPTHASLIFLVIFNFSRHSRHSRHSPCAAGTFDMTRIVCHPAYPSYPPPRATRCVQVQRLPNRNACKGTTVSPFAAQLPNLIRSLLKKLAAVWKTGGCMEFQKSFVEMLDDAQAEQAERGANPWRRALERDLPANVTCISSVAVLDLLGLAPTTGNARRIAPTMRSMGFIPLKSRRLMPGGNRGTTIRGWARPFLEPKKSIAPAMR